MFQRPCCLHPYGCRNCIQVDTEVITMRMWFDYTGTRTGSPEQAMQASHPPLKEASKMFSPRTRQFWTLRQPSLTCGLINRSCDFPLPFYWSMKKEPCICNFPYLHVIHIFYSCNTENGHSAFFLNSSISQFLLAWTRLYIFKRNIPLITCNLKFPEPLCIVTKATDKDMRAVCHRNAGKLF